ncbi:MAG: phenylalanine-4-hydroxylase PhhA [Fluviicola sp.]|jgi:phenylalanine-4-hydroxylase|uniref:phenylalanine 4-monooxygenase n=1 Tax=Fluviicola sp. TaxID=1917219 RepID=UPI00263A16B6|nr:phenylalanine 4-monooxygenase [Fluviicola sp.]MDF3027165.1 phenylalanine-4-hydroxylase PhhA [Fluviicola sp.]
MEQEFEKYTSEDLAVWSLLFERQVNNLQEKACSDYLESLEKMRKVLNPMELPNFERINEWFKMSTGWEIYCVPGLIGVEEFFDLLSEKKFPSSTWLRSKEKLDYLEEPDMFHDIFGHIPLLCNPGYSEFVHEFGMLGKRFSHDSRILVELQRLYWFTIEFGLISEENKLRIFGAGIISSFHESISSISTKGTTHSEFKVETILQTDFCTSEIQQKYFVIEDISQLKKAIETLTKLYSHELEHHSESI